MLFTVSIIGTNLAATYCYFYMTSTFGFIRKSKHISQYLNVPSDVIPVPKNGSLSIPMPPKTYTGFGRFSVITWIIYVNWWWKVRRWFSSSTTSFYYSATDASRPGFGVTKSQLLGYWLQQSAEKYSCPNTEVCELLRAPTSNSEYFKLFLQGFWDLHPYPFTCF